MSKIVVIDFQSPGVSGPAGSYQEPEIDLNTYILYKDLLLKDNLVFDKVKCFV